jgi:hypothetical protein
MLRFIFASLTALCLSAFVFAQAASPALPADVSRQPAPRDGASGESARTLDIPAQPFPLTFILETILAGEILWRPDWPVEIPPDLFTVSGSARSVTVSLEFPVAGTEPSGADVSEADDSPEPADSAVYTLSRDETGRLTDFPFFVNGGFFQTAVNYDEIGRISGALVSAPTVWQIEFIEHDDKTGLPSLARLNAGNAAGTIAADADSGSGGAWFFAALKYGGASVSETWYDPAGTGLAVYNYRYLPLDGKKRLAEYAAVLPDGESRAEDYHYDSWGNLTGIGGVYSAVYYGRGPLYWRRPLPSSSENAAVPDAAEANGGGSVSPGEIPWRFTFQWDERGLVTRLRAYPEDADAGDGWDARYDYFPYGGEADGGAWEERRETRMTRGEKDNSPLGNYLFPRPGVLIRRQITYREQ